MIATPSYRVSASSLFTLKSLPFSETYVSSIHEDEVLFQAIRSGRRPSHNRVFVHDHVHGRSVDPLGGSNTKDFQGDPLVHERFLSTRSRS